MTGIGCWWWAQAALGSKMAMKTCQRWIEVNLYGTSLIAPSQPWAIHPVSIPSWHLMPHEAWCWLPWSGAVRSREVHLHVHMLHPQYGRTHLCALYYMTSVVFKWRGWAYWSHRKMGKLFRKTMQRTTQFWINWDYRIHNQMCDQVATEIVPLLRRL